MLVVSPMAMAYRPRKTLEEAERDWEIHAKKKADLWATNVSSPAAADKYSKKMAAFLGLSEATVAASLPVAGYKKFQTKASEVKSNFIAGVEDAAKAKRWSTNLKTAFSTPA
jgi:hypothetical protein